MSTETYSRRSVLRAGAGAAIGGAALANAQPARAQTTFDGWLDGVSNYDGVVDQTGQDEVSVEVGAEANGGNFGFGPAAIQVDPGTTVTWEWVNGSHNVEADDGSFKSELTSEAGFTFSQTFDSEGVTKYFCMPHKSMGMKGVVVVGDIPGGSGGSTGGSSESASPPEFDSWLDGVGNYDGIVDETGASEVSVEVGAEANGGNFGFGPAAIQVDPGTTVTWEWVNGSHNVVDDGGDFESELTNESGFTFSQTFDAEGVTKYFCMPHKSMGMKGVVVVGDADVGGSGSAGGQTSGGDAGGGGGSEGANGDLTSADWGAIAFGLSLVAGLLSPLAFAAFIDRKDDR